jgi:lysyl-tRNA synthetase class 2
VEKRLLLKKEGKKLQLLRDKNTAYINDFLKEHYAHDLHGQYDELSKEDLESKNIDNISVAGRNCTHEGNG